MLITGAGRGLGRELALIFAEKGYHLILHGRKRENLESVSKEVAQKGVKANIVEGDLRNDKTLEVLARIAKEKEISLLINNAGAGSAGVPLEQEKDEDIVEVITTNLISQIKLTKRIYPLFLKKGKGDIININSICGLEPRAVRAVYCASRWGLRGFTESLRKEVEGKGVRILEIYPTRIKTRPEYTKGMEAREVVQKIYHAYADTLVKDLVLDDRPQKSL